MAPKTEKGFHIACADLSPDRAFVVYPGSAKFPLKDKAEAIGIVALLDALG